MIADAHTHHPGRRGAIISVAPAAFAPEEGLIYSVGIHPWDTDTADGQTLRALEEAAADPHVAAIGETGIDKLRGASTARQEEIFAAHIRLSELAGKPLIIHCVRAAAEIVAMRRREKPRQPWIWHGFRGSPQMALQLAREGVYLSVGERFRADAVAAIPEEKLLIETDESELTISQIAARVAAARGDCPAALEKAAAERLSALLSADAHIGVPGAELRIG